MVALNYLEALTYLKIFNWFKGSNWTSNKSYLFLFRAETDTVLEIGKTLER